MSWSGNYDELEGYLRNFVSMRGDPAPYDAGGVIHLMLAIVDNLKEHGLPEDFYQYAPAINDDQAAVLAALLAARTARST